MNCWTCAETVYEEDQVRCDACTNVTHPGCLSSEGDDGQLCADCGDACSCCDMITLRDQVASLHYATDNGTLFRCPFEDDEIHAEEE